MNWLTKFFTKRSKPLIEVTYTDRSTFPPFEFVVSMNPKTDERRKEIRESFYDFVIDGATTTDDSEEFNYADEQRPEKDPEGNVRKID